MRLALFRKPNQVIRGRRNSINHWTSRKASLASEYQRIVSLPLCVPFARFLWSRSAGTLCVLWTLTQDINFFFPYLKDCYCTSVGGIYLLATYIYFSPFYKTYPSLHLISNRPSETRETRLMMFSFPCYRISQFLVYHVLFSSSRITFLSLEFRFLIPYRRLLSFIDCAATAHVCTCVRKGFTGHIKVNHIRRQ